MDDQNLISDDSAECLISMEPRSIDIVPYILRASARDDNGEHSIKNTERMEAPCSKRALHRGRIWGRYGRQSECIEPEKTRPKPSDERIVVPATMKVSKHHLIKQIV